MNESWKTVVRCAVGVTEKFKVEVGLHQGSSVDRLTGEVRQESLWLIFAGDIVVCSESREQVEEKLERWSYVLERRGMKVTARENICA